MPSPLPDSPRLQLSPPFVSETIRLNDRLLISPWNVPGESVRIKLMETLVYAICFCVGSALHSVERVFRASFRRSTMRPYRSRNRRPCGGGLPGYRHARPFAIQSHHHCSFITAFGGFGLIFSHIEATSNVWISLPLSILGGLIVAGAVLVAFRRDFSQYPKLQRRARGLIGRPHRHRHHSHSAVRRG